MEFVRNSDVKLVPHSELVADEVGMFVLSAYRSLYEDNKSKNLNKRRTELPVPEAGLTLSFSAVMPIPNRSGRVLASRRKALMATSPVTTTSFTFTGPQVLMSVPKGYDSDARSFVLWGVDDLELAYVSIRGVAWPNPHKVRYELHGFNNFPTHQMSQATRECSNPTV